MNIQAVEVGDVVPDFSLKAANNKIYSLKDFRGSYVFLNFWATWCPPCREELPSMELLNNRFKTKNFNMIAISVDDSWPEITSYVKSLPKPPGFLILHDPDKKFSHKLGTNKYPETYLIGPDGKLLDKFVGSRNWVDGAVFKEIQDLIFKKSE